MAKYYKIIIWQAAVAVLAWWMWVGGQSAKFNAVTGINFELSSLAAFILLTAFLVLGYILFQQRRWALTTAGIIGLIFLASFGWNWLDLVAIGIFTGFNLWSANRVKREIVERKIMNIPDAFYHGLTGVVLGLFVMISFAAYQSPLLAQIKKASSLPGQTQVFVQQIVDKTLGQKISASTPQQRSQVINEIASQTLGQLNSFLKPYFQYAPPVLAFGLFLILSGLSFIFIWCGMFVGMILFWILKKTGVVKIEERDVKAEVLVV
jgi:hypothetical protein